jgi:hypothetical protein
MQHSSYCILLIIIDNIVCIVEINDNFNNNDLIYILIINNNNINVSVFQINQSIQIIICYILLIMIIT